MSPQIAFPHTRPLDGLRAVAVLLVLFTHCELPIADNGNIGVEIFFVLSGFLITTLLLKEYQRNNTFSIKAFYIRRVFRLFPALYVLLLFILAASLLFKEGNEQLPVIQEVISSALYVNNISWVWGWTHTVFLVHTWSLACEEQFYLLWPWILLIALARNGLKALTICCFLFIGAVSLLKITGSLSPIGYSLFQESIFTGCLAALLIWSDMKGLKINSRLALILLIIILAIGLLPFPYFNEISERGGKTTAGLLTAFLITGLIQNPESTVARMLSGRLLGYIGKISYALYLWHVPVYLVFKYHSPLNTWIAVIPKLAVTFLCAALSWTWLENKTQLFGSKLSERLKRKQKSKSKKVRDKKSPCLRHGL